MKHTYEAWALQRADGSLWDGYNADEERRGDATIPTWPMAFVAKSQAEFDTDTPVKVRVTIETIDTPTLDEAVRKALERGT